MFTVFRTSHFSKQAGIFLFSIFMAAVLLQGCNKIPNESKLEEMSETEHSVARSPVPGKSGKEEGPGPNILRDKKLVKTGKISLEVSSLEPAAIKLKEMTEKAGGYVESEDIQRDKSDRYSGYFKIRVPSESFEKLFGNFNSLGKTVTQSSNVEDITVDYYDTVLRLENMEELRNRLRHLLATRSGKLEDVVDLEIKIAEVTADIESLKGRIRYYDKNVSMSTINIYMNEPESLVEAVRTPFWKRILKGFVGAWDNFIGFIVFFISSMGIILPLAALMYPVYRLYVYLKDRLQVKSAAKQNRK